MTSTDGPTTSTGAAYFTVTDARYFLGTAVLVRSLRATGNDEPVVVLDAGLREDQRAALASECHVVPLAAADGGAANPTYYKLLAPLAAAADLGVDVVVLVDGDMIATGDLTPLLEAARSGRVAGYPEPNPDRWFAEWEEIFALPASPRRQTYMNAGIVAFSRAAFPDLLPRWQAACARIVHLPTIAEGAVGPVAAADQDALNAVLMSSLPAGTLALRPHEESPQGHELLAGPGFARPRIVDRAALACTFAGTPSRLLHSSGNPKPWTSWRGMGRTAYTELFVDLVAARDAVVPVPPDDVPWWLRPGRLPAAARATVGGLRLAGALGRRLPRALGRRVLGVVRRPRAA